LIYGSSNGLIHVYLSAKGLWSSRINPAAQSERKFARSEAKPARQPAPLPARQQFLLAMQQEKPHCVP